MSLTWAFFATQKSVVAVVLVALSHVIVTVQFRNCGTAGTILRSYLELAGKAKRPQTAEPSATHGTRSTVTPSSTIAATRSRCCSALPNSAASVAARL